VASGEAVATYIKRLVREDIKKGETTWKPAEK
jgi:hypothetical protein